MDVKQIVDGIAANPSSVAKWIAVGVALVLLLSVLSRIVPRAWRVIEEVFFTNWQLAMLGTAAIVLSLAGGWTTWDGMTNFTGEPVLSLMFTFGIHATMLIIAWLIGESFATGMSTVSRSGIARATYPLAAIAGSGVVLLAAATAVYQWRHGISADRWVQVLMIGGLGLGAFGLLLMFARSDVITPYTQALRIIAKNAMLWVMFLATMATSVFFSFDSRFNVVFPQDERKRVADLRAQNQVTGILADIEGTITARRLEQSQHLFESEGWRGYDVHLANLARAAQGSQGDIERYFVQQMEDRRRGIAEQQERIATAQSGQAGLANKKISLTEELARIKGDRPGLAAEYAQHKSELDAKQREIDAKRVEALAEDRGVEGTLKQGRGPVYRERMAELGRLQDEYKIKAERTKDAQKRLVAVETRIAQIERELSGIDGDLAKLKGEAQTAEQRIQAAADSGPAAEGSKVDPARALLAFENARGEFRQEPTVERLAQVQQLCAEVYGALNNALETKEKVRNIDCDAKQASEAAAVLFALNAGFKAFETNCAGGEKLAPHTNADALFGFARKCLADSGLPSKDTDQLRTKISFTELTRDDRAHRFVVSWNAFNDGNRLAYLALAIAIGIDSLIFMTGLFGANAVRSPLADVPRDKPRNSQQLEAIIENALLPDKFDNARLALQAMRPITNEGGFMAEVRPDLLAPHTADRVLGVLNAGATINAVEYDDQRDRYLVRAELFEFLSIVAKKAFDSDKSHVDLAELEKVVGVALLPQVGPNAEMVLNYMHPISEDQGFTAEIMLNEVEKHHLRTVRNTLNAGATLERVQRAGRGAEHYFIHRDLYRTLARIRARTLMHDGVGRQQIAGQSQRSVDITPVTPAITRQLTSSNRGEPDYKTGFIEDLSEALGIEPSSFLQISGAAFGAAVAASEAFSRLRRNNHLLDRELTARDEQARMSLDTAFSHLKASLPADDAWRQQSLVAAYQDIDQNWAVLMLLPNGPYERVLTSLVERLEPDNASGDLPEDQEALLSAAKRLRAVLLSSTRDGEHAWKRLEASLHQAWQGHPTHAGLGNGRRTIN